MLQSPPSTQIPDTRVLELQRRARTLSSVRNENGVSNHVQEMLQTEVSPSGQEIGKVRAMANWDPSYSTEKVDWYGEYIARHAPISISWLQQPVVDLSDNEAKREIRGMGLLADHGDMKAVGPLEDGSVCVWDIGHSGRVGGRETRRGAILACSKPGLLSVNDQDSASLHSSSESRAKMTSTGVVECVSIDHVRNKAYFAVQSSLNEVDLNTLQISSHENYPFSISALSSTDYPVPLTIGTTLSLHLHDPRQSHNARSSDAISSESRLDTVANFPTCPRPRNDFHRLLSGDHIPRYAPLFQPGPLSILHISPPGCNDPTQSSIYVAGRFPSVLVYDRRTFPKLSNTIHSGARLCSLTSSPHPFNSLDTDLMRQNRLSLSAAREAKSQLGQTLVACGEYNGKGSLEVYGVSPYDLPFPSQAGAAQNSTYKNRVSASGSKLLSVVAHGTRLVVSDGDGYLRWFERDGRTPVRRWNINRYAATESWGLFNRSALEATPVDVARKLLPTNGNVGGRHINRDEILLWTGEKIGLLGFQEEPRFGADEWEESMLSAEESGRRKEERRYGEVMRRALERQADEVRFIRGLGLRGGL